MCFSYKAVYGALLSDVITTASGLISLANWLSWVVLFEPLPSHKGIVQAPIETVIVEGTFACQGELVLWIWRGYEWKCQNPKSPVQDTWTCLNRPECGAPPLRVILLRPVRITPWYPNFNGSHFNFGLQPCVQLDPQWTTEWLGVKIVWTMTYSHKPQV